MKPTPCSLSLNERQMSDVIGRREVQSHFKIYEQDRYRIYSLKRWLTVSVSSFCAACNQGRLTFTSLAYIEGSS